LFKGVRERLAEGGYFIFDAWYGPGVLSDPPSPRLSSFESTEGKIWRFAQPIAQPQRNIVHIDYTIIAMDNSKIREINEAHEMRFFFLPEIQLLLKAVGLELVSASGWLKDVPPGLKDWYAIFIARKGIG
jgi:hypothetical protein